MSMTASPGLSPLPPRPADETPTLGSVSTSLSLGVLRHRLTVVTGASVRPRSSPSSLLVDEGVEVAPPRAVHGAGRPELQPIHRPVHDVHVHFSRATWSGD